MLQLKYHIYSQFEFVHPCISAFTLNPHFLSISLCHDLYCMFEKIQVLRMEHLLLKVLRFDVAVPTTNVFCDRFLKETKADEKTMALAMVCILLVIILTGRILTSSFSGTDLQNSLWLLPFIFSTICCKIQTMLT